MSVLRVAVVGAGGCAREVRWILREINRARETYSFAGYIVSDVARLGERDSRAEVRGDFGWLASPEGRSVDALVLGIGTPAPRLRVAAELRAGFPALQWPAVIHPSAGFDRETCRMGDGVVLWPSVFATVNVTLGDYTMVSSACTLGHEATLGRGCVLNPSVNISGGVVLGDGVLVGTGAQVLQYLRIGAGATVGAGAVVTKDVPPAVTVVGVPARLAAPR